MGKERSWAAEEASGRRCPGEMDDEEVVVHSKRQRIDFERMYRDGMERLVGNVGIAEHEDRDERYEALNRSLLSLCMALASHGANLAPLFLQYKQLAAGFDSPRAVDGEDGALLSLCDFKPFRDEAVPGGAVGCGEGGQHKCPPGEMYRFLVRHFGVQCPNMGAGDELADSLEAFRRMEKMAEFPFSKPLGVGKGPGMSFSMSRREDVGNQNRRVFEAITALRKDRNALGYVKNPEFFEDSSEDECSGDKHVVREEVVCKYYDCGRYRLVGSLVLRAFFRDGRGYVNMRAKDRVVFKDLEAAQVKLVHSKGDDTIYMLVLETMVIYKLVCRHPSIAQRIHSHLAGARPSDN